MLASGRLKQEYEKFKASPYYLDTIVSFSKKGKRKKGKKGKEKGTGTGSCPCMHFNLLINKQKFDETLSQKQNKTPSCITAVVL